MIPLAKNAAQRVTFGPSNLVLLLWVSDDPVSAIFVSSFKLKYASSVKNTAVSCHGQYLYNLNFAKVLIYILV